MGDGLPGIPQMNDYSKINNQQAQDDMLRFYLVKRVRKNASAFINYMCFFNIRTAKTPIFPISQPQKARGKPFSKTVFPTFIYSIILQ